MLSTAHRLRNIGLEDSKIHYYKVYAFPQVLLNFTQEPIPNFSLTFGL